MEQHGQIDLPTSVEQAHGGTIAPAAEEHDSEHALENSTVLN